MHNEMWVRWPSLPKLPEVDAARDARAWMRRDPTIKSVTIEVEPVVARLGDNVTRFANCAILKAVR